MDNYRIGIVLEPILGVSYRLLLYWEKHITCITADWADNRSRYTGWSKDIRAPLPGHQPQMTPHPSTNRKWYQQSTVNHSNVSAHYPVLKLTEHARWFVANRLHVPPIAYKLRSPSDLPGLMIKWLGHQRKEYSCRIGAFPYRPFSSAK